MSWDYPTDSDRKREREEEMQYKGEEDCTGCTRCNRKLYFDEHGEPSACPDCTTKDAPPYKTPRNAQDVRQELVTALGTENQPVQWIRFMDAVTRLLPNILSPGRPSTAAIQASPIGQLGFKSWQEMIEAPADAHGLAWNFSQWKAWRRAWATVQANPWLRSQPLSSSEVNTLANEFKPFPESLEALQALRQAKGATAEQKRTITLTEALKAAQEAQAAAVVLREQLAEAASRERILAEEVGTLKGQLERALIEIDTLRRPDVLDQGGSSTTTPKLHRNWWSRLLAFLGFRQ